MYVQITAVKFWWFRIIAFRCSSYRFLLASFDEPQFGPLRLAEHYFFSSPHKIRPEDSQPVNSRQASYFTSVVFAFGSMYHPAIVFATYYQSLFVKLLVENSEPSLDAQRREEHRWIDLLLCLEMVFFAAALMFAFPVKGACCSIAYLRHQRIMCTFVVEIFFWCSVYVSIGGFIFEFDFSRITIEWRECRSWLALLHFRLMLLLLK